MIKTIINSTLGLSTAFLMTIILHEIAHYTMSVILGYETILYHNRVISKTNGIKSHEILIAGLAPIFSLIQGFVAFNYSKRMTKSNLSMLVLWFGLAGIITFFGYLMIAPIFPFGDTGKVFDLLNIPTWIQTIISIISIIIFTIIMIKSTKEFEKYAIDDFGSTIKNRKKWAFSFIFIPLIISIVIITIFQFPIPHFISVLATICAPFSIMAVFGSFIGNKETIKRDLTGKSINEKISITIIILFIISIIINRILVAGI